jgi:hypothetical protein
MGADTIDNHPWRLAARENWWLIGVASVMLVVSWWMTFG